MPLLARSGSRSRLGSLPPVPLFLRFGKVSAVGSAALTAAAPGLLVVVVVVVVVVVLLVVVVVVLALAIAAAVGKAAM